MTVHSHGTPLQEHDARTDTELACNSALVLFNNFVFGK